MNTAIFLVIGILAFVGLIAVVAKGDADDVKDDYWRDCDG